MHDEFVMMTMTAAFYDMFHFLDYTRLGLSGLTQGRGNAAGDHGLKVPEHKD